MKKFKYLGTTITQTLGIHPHIKSINSKASFIMLKLLPLRRFDDFKLNRNLFQIFIEPSFRLLAGIYGEISQREKENVEKCYRRIFRKCCNLPPNTETEIIEILNGRLMSRMMGINKNINHKDDCHMNNRRADDIYLANNIQKT